jgi:hypothetical protein
MKKRKDSYTLIASGIARFSNPMTLAQLTDTIQGVIEQDISSDIITLIVKRHVEMVEQE